MIDELQCPKPTLIADAKELCHIMSQAWFPNDLASPTSWWSTHDEGSKAWYCWYSGTFQKFIEDLWDENPDEYLRQLIIVEYTKYRLSGQLSKIGTGL